MSEDLDKWCRDNWDKVPASDRARCLDHLRSAIPADVLAAWKSEGFPAGFHLFAGGMQVRNVLREVMKDDALPGVMYGDALMHNWDDYYTGALAELMEDAPATFGDALKRALDQR